MTKTIAAALLTAGFLTIDAVPARAQAAPPSKNIFLDVNFGAQPSSGTFTTSAAPIVYGETAPMTSIQTYSGATLLDISGGYRVWHSLSIGLAFTTTFPSKGDAAVTVGVPSPVFFDRRVTVNQAVADLERKEQAVHLMFMWTSPVSDKVDASIFGGPSYFKLYQDLVQGFNVVQGTQTGTATTEQQTATSLGFNVGGDMTYLINPKLGVGGLVRYVKGTMDLPAVLDVKVGGIQIGGGLRVRF